MSVCMYVCVQTTTYFTILSEQDNFTKERNSIEHGCKDREELKSFLTNIIPPMLVV